MPGQDDTRGTKRASSGGASNEPATKRRVTRACDQCRATRERCDGQRPVCGTCITQQRTCAWNEPTKKRGIQPNYIRSLELMIAWLFQNNPASEKHLAQHLPQVEGLAYRLIGCKDSVAAERLHQKWRASIVSKQLGQVLSGGVVEWSASPPVVEETGQTSPATSLDTVDQTKASRRDTSVAYREGSVKSLDDSDAMQQSLLSIPQDSSHTRRPRHERPLASREYVIQLPENAWTLIEWYVAYTHSWLPFIDKHEVLKAMYAFPGANVHDDSNDSVHYCDLFAVLAIAATQMHQVQGGESPEKLQKDARKLLRHQRGKTSSVTTYLLHAILDFTESRLLDSWLHLGSVQRLLSFPHPINKASASPFWERCRRVKIAAALLENALAARLSTPPQCSLSGFDSSYLIDEEGDEEWAPWRDPLRSDATSRMHKSPTKSCSTFNHLARTLLISNALEQGSFSAASGQSAKIVCELITNACSSSGRRQPSNVVSGYASHVPQLANVASVELPPQPSLATPQPSQQPLVGADPLTANQYGFPAANQVVGVEDANLLPPADDIPFSAGSEMLDFDAYDNLSSTYADDDFLRNLGFRPELDLAELYFNPSDPFLSLMDTGQPEAGVTGEHAQP